jgi:hypothetical protein
VTAKYSVSALEPARNRRGMPLADHDRNKIIFRRRKGIGRI